MKKLLLLGAMTAMFMVNGNAFDAKSTVQTPVKDGKAITAVKVLDTQTFASDKAMVQTCLDAQGRKFKRLVKLNDVDVHSVAVNTPSTIHTSRADMATIAESFETGEMPDGWSTYSDETCIEPQPWRVDTPFMVSGTDGDYACYSGTTWSFDDTYDEWLYTPSFVVQPDYVLSYLGAHDLIWMLNTLYLEDDGTFSEYVPAGVVKIWAIDVETGEKTLIHDYFEDVIGLTWDGLFECYTGNFEEYTYSLNDFVGKEIKIAFQNVGANGNSVYVDRVVVDVPSADCSYTFPDGTLFWGLNRGYMGLNLEVAMVPVYKPITWTAQSDIENASYFWSYYTNQSVNDFLFDSQLTETYTPDYDSTFSTNTNLFYTPELYCMADGFSMGIYSIYDYFQAGGRPDFYQSDSDSFLNFLLHCSNHATEGFTNIGTGREGIPAFGYGVLEDGYNIHDFWTKYFTGKASADVDPENWVKFKGVTNVYSMPEGPLVIRKVVGFFNGSNINPDAEFVVEISILGEDGSSNVIATAVCKGSETEATLGESYFAADFVFDTPVVITPDMGESFIISWTGFDGAGEYVAVMSNYWAPQNGINHGYAVFDIMQGGSLIEDGMLPLEAAIDVPGTFGMMLDAEMPWLAGPEEEIEAAPEAIAVALDSFYPGEELTVEAPEWIEASVEGRWGDCVLSIAQTKDSEGRGKVTVSGPGVSYSVDIKGTTGISAITDIESAGIAEVYNLQGVKVAKSNMAPGVYVVRQTNGIVRKAVVK